jgi:hypothetical protein
LYPELVQALRQAGIGIGMVDSRLFHMRDRFSYMRKDGKKNR